MLGVRACGGGWLSARGRLGLVRVGVGWLVGLAGCLLVVGVLAAPAMAASVGTVTNFTGTGISGPEGIAAGPDGALWFTNAGNDSIGRITTGGTVTNFTGTGISDPFGIAAGPDGALWFTNCREQLDRADHDRRHGHQLHRPRHQRPAGDRGGARRCAVVHQLRDNSIGRITTGGTVTNYTGPGISEPDGIAAGPDGALWFTNFGNSSIGRITTGGTVTNFTGTGISDPDCDRGGARRGAVVHQLRE